MDEIQKVLVKAGRKDLAQKYYQKVSVELMPSQKVWIQTGLPDGNKLDMLYDKNIVSIIKKYKLNNNVVKKLYNKMSENVLNEIDSFVDEITAMIDQEI